MKVPIGISKRHVHLTKETFEKIFGETIFEKRNLLNQPGEFASTLSVDVSCGCNTINKVRVVGPFRNYNQIEVSQTDADLLGVNLLIRKSGDIKGTGSVTITGNSGSVNLSEGLVIAERHIHLNKEESKKFDLKDDEVVLIYKEGVKLFDAKIKVSDMSFLELHIDEDDAKKHNLNNGDEAEVYKCGKSEI